jgi:tetratricopeptide (TPR) repeat protein
VARAPDDPAVYIARGAFRRVTGQFEAALNDLNTALEFDPESVDALIERAIVKGLQSEFLAAYDDFSAALALDPQSDRAFFQRANLLGAIQEYAAAIEDLNQALLLAPDEARYLIARGDAWRLNGELARAAEDYAAALASDPTAAGAYAGQAYAYLAQSDDEAAITAFQAAVALEPDDATLLALAETLRRTGACDEAITHYSAVLAGEPGQPAGLYGRALCHLALDDDAAALRDITAAALVAESPAEALRTVNNALAAFGDHPVLWTARGDIYFRAGQMERALLDYDAVLADDPENPEVLVRRGGVLLALGRLEAARADLMRYTELVGEANVPAVVRDALAGIEAQLNQD